MIAVLVLAACLFPLAPYQVKIVVVYLSMGILLFLMGAILLRGVIAAATWMAVGRSFWILPNVLSEVGLDSKPMPSGLRVQCFRHHAAMACSSSCFIVAIITPLCCIKLADPVWVNYAYACQRIHAWLKKACVYI